MVMVGERRPTSIRPILASRPVLARSRLTTASLTIVLSKRIPATTRTTRITKRESAQRIRRRIRTSGHDNVFRQDFQALVLIFPQDGRIMFQETRQQLGGGKGQECFSLAGGVVASVVVVGHALALMIVPMRHRVDDGVVIRPALNWRLQVRRQ